MKYICFMFCWYGGQKIRPSDFQIAKMFFYIPLHLVMGVVAEMFELWMPLVDT